MRLIYTFDKHAKEPDKTIDVYIKEKKVELGIWVSKRKKVYLDTKFWLLLRNAHLGRAKLQEQNDLLRLLNDGVVTGKVICPISEDIFQEVIKQSDQETLKATISLIDTLSSGVSLLPQDERCETEVLHFIRSCTNPTEKLHELHQLIWTKLAYTSGMQIPHNELLSAEDNLLIQKSFMDQMWNMSLQEMIEIIGSTNLSTFPHMPDLSSYLNEEKERYHVESASFDKIFLSELAFLLEREAARFDEMFAYLFKKESGYSPTLEEEQASKPGRSFANLIHNAFRKQKIGDRLPAFEIEAGIHAQLIYDKTRRYKSNDIHDINHASAALPYCDYFFTEKNLREFIRKKNLSYNTKYNCTVISSIADAVSEIRRVVSYV